MANVKISTINTSEGYQQPVNPNTTGVLANGFYPQNATSNDANAGVERNTSEQLTLKAGNTSIVTIAPPASAIGGIVRITNSSTSTASLQIDPPTNDAGALQVYGSDGGGLGATADAVNIVGYPNASGTTMRVRNDGVGTALTVASLDGSQPALVVNMAGGTGDAINANGTVQATTFSGSGALLTSIPNSATTAASTNTASAIVARDASGNFAAGTITASLNGNATTATNATNVATADETASASTFYPALLGATSGNNGARVSSTKLTFVPSTGRLTATSFGGSGAGLTNIPNSATTATNANTASAIVARDANGAFSAGIVTATGVTVASGSATADNVTITANTSGAALRVTQTGAGEAIRVEDAANPDSSPFVITATGAAGVGTASPEQRLDVRGGTEVNAQVYADTASATRADLRLRINNTTGDNYVTFGDSAAFDVGRIQYNHNSDYMALFTNSTERVRIDTSGNVGVGITPASGIRLHVASDTNTWIRSQAAGGIPLINCSRSSGTNASPTAVALNDELGRFDVRGYNNGDFRQAAQISVACATTPGASDTAIAGTITLSTSPGGTTAPASRVFINQTGNVQINAPGSGNALIVKGNLEFNDGTVQATSAGTISRLTAAVTTTSTAFTDITGLTASLAATTAYFFEAYLIWQQNNTAGGIGFAINGPGSMAVLDYTIQYQNFANDAAGTIQTVHSGTYDSAYTIPTTTTAANTNYIARISGVLATTITAGTLALRFKSSNASYTASIRPGSWLLLRRGNT